MAGNGNLLLKLLLNTADFDKNLRKSKKEVNDFAALGSKGFSGLTSMLGKFAGAAGIAVGGYELFNKAIASSQSLTDSWGRTIEVAKVGFDNLVYSIANADFTAFNNGLSDMAERAKAAYDAYDQLANTVMSGNFSMSLDQANYREQMMIARNKSLPMEQRQAALDQARALAQTMSETSQKIFDDSMAALKAQFSALGNVDASGITPNVIEQAFRVDAKKTSAKERAAIESQYKWYEGLIAATKQQEEEALNSIGAVPMQVRGSKNLEISKMYDKRRDEIRRRYANIIVRYYALNRLEDDELSKAMQTFLSATNTRNTTSEMFSSINELSTTMSGEIATKAKANAARKVATTTTAAAPRTIGLNLGMPTIALPDKISGITDESEIERYRQGLAKVQGEHLFAEQQEELEGMRESVGMLGDAFGSLGNSIGGAAGSMLEWVGSTAQAVQAILPFLSYLAAEATLHDANATAAMKEAAAKTLAAYSGIPFAGVAMGLAAVASIVGVMSTLPEFAQGGIVTSRTVGVFGEAGPEAVMPLDRLNEFIDTSRREVRVTGVVKGSGKDLQVVLNNYERARSVKNGQ